eukprot:9236845-Pyramimonas_sp.AAC.1
MCEEGCAPSSGPPQDPRSPTLYTGASYGTWVSPRNPYVANEACFWESWVFTKLVTPAFWTLVRLMYCATHLEDASGILHF